jgi:hypothetical protein
MTEILSTFREQPLLSPRTANYVAALMRDGDNFDYSKWLQAARKEETQAKQVPAAFTSVAPIAAEIGNSGSKSDCRRAWSNSGSALIARAAPLPRAIYRSHHEIRNKPPQAGFSLRLEKIREAWDDFQTSRARDAVYGYLGSVFEIVMH